MNPPNWPAIQTEWNTNPRLRLGGWLILALLLGYAWSAAHDHNNRLRSEHQSIRQQLTKLEHLSRQPHWPQRAAQAAEQLQQREQTLWRAANPSLAQAEIQSWVQQTLKALPFPDAVVKVADARREPVIDNLWSLEIRIEGNTTQGDVLQLIHNLEQQTNRTIIHSLKLHPTRNRMFHLTLTAYFQTQPEPNP